MIYITHGVVQNRNAKRISHGLMLSESLFASHLQRRQTKYVSLERALAGEGDALTIDDATYAGWQASLLARGYGHAVSWFVNGMNVEQKRPYFPFQLSWLLDETQKASCLFDGQRWNLSDEDQRRALRLHLKRCYLKMVNCEEIDRLVEAISDVVGVELTNLDRALCTVTAKELTVAIEAGVELHNHGWSHMNPLTLSERALTADLQLNEEFLLRFRQPSAGVFAPPFGHRVDVAASGVRHVLLADRTFVYDPQAGHFVNRSDLDLTTPRRAAIEKCESLAISA